MYGGEAKVEIQTWHGHRLLGVDSSLARLPNSAECGSNSAWSR